LPQKQTFRFYRQLSWIHSSENRSVYERNTTNPLQIVIITITDAAYRRMGIEQQNASLICYAHRYPNYRFLSLDFSYSYACLHIPNVYFRKHCVILMYMINHPDIDWILVLDADIGVVDLTRRIEEYLPTKNETDIHIVFYERFNGEVHAGGYLIQNHPWSHRFLIGWLDWEPRITSFPGSNGDNGALHMHLLDTVEGVSQKIRDECWHAYGLAVPYNDTYQFYIGCVKCALDYRWEFRHIRILRRGHGYISDPIFGARLIASHDFLMHGDKNNMTIFYTHNIDTDECRRNSSWQLPLRLEMIVYNVTEARDRFANADNSVARGLWMGIGVADIGHCWPHCSSVTSEQWRAKFKDKLCKHALWKNITFYA
jgi:hypothetical protein